MKRKHESIDVIDITLDDDDDGPNTAYSSSAVRDATTNKDGIAPAVPHADGGKEYRISTRIISVFPGICPDFVRKLYRDQAKGSLPPPTEETLADAILQLNGYPMKEDTKRRRLMQTNAQKSTRWGVDDNVKRDRRYFSSAKSIIRLDFPHIPSGFVKRILQEKGCLYAAYLELDSIDATYDSTDPKPYERQDDLDMGSDGARLAGGYSGDLKRELREARTQCKRNEDNRRAQKEKLDAEAKNAAMHAATGGLIECQCCYGDTPLNRMTCCSGDEVHFFCSSCMKSTAETQIGMMKYDIKCMDMSGCSAPFSRKALVDVLGDGLISKLDEFQQRDEIASASIEGLEECPFCDFKAICPPVEEDKEFRCLKPDCKKTSCRLCRGESHIPKSCDEVKNEKNIPVRHAIEEAMSEAIIRICPNPKCKTPIIKEDGCNKMSCTKCRRKMCYVCKKDITKDGYNHFTDTVGSCALHDNGRGNLRHIDEATKAREQALQKALKENPHLREEDIGVDAPKQTLVNSIPMLMAEEELNRIRRRGPQPPGGAAREARLPRNVAVAQPPNANLPALNVYNPNIPVGNALPRNLPGNRHLQTREGQLQQVEAELRREEQARLRLQNHFQLLHGHQRAQAQAAQAHQARAHAQQVQARAQQAQAQQAREQAQQERERAQQARERAHQARVQAQNQPPHPLHDPFDWMLQFDSQPALPVFGETWQPDPYPYQYPALPTFEGQQDYQFATAAFLNPTPFNRQFDHYQEIYQTNRVPVIERDWRLRRSAPPIKLPPAECAALRAAQTRNGQRGNEAGPTINPEHIAIDGRQPQA